MLLRYRILLFTDFFLLNMSFDPLINESFQDFEGINIVDISARCKKFNIKIDIPETDNNIFCSCITGSERVSSMNFTQSSSSSSKDIFIQSLVNIVSDYFSLSLDITYFYSSEIYSNFVILKKETRNTSTRSTLLTPLAVSFFHYNPTVGNVIPILVVDKDYQNRGLGKLCLALLQDLTLEKLADARMMLWLSFTLDDFNNGYELYTYYRKLGLHLIVPSNYPIQYLFRPQLTRLLLQPQRRNHLPTSHQEDIDDEMLFDTNNRDQFNFLLGTNNILTVDHHQQSTMQYKVDREDGIVRDTLVCDICCSQRLSSDVKVKMDAKSDLFVCCKYECEKSNSILYNSTSKKSKFICGSVMCFTCHNQFGFPETSECPVHLCTDNLEEVGELNKSLLKLSIKNMSLQLNNESSRIQFFSPNTENFISVKSTYQPRSEEKECKHCYIFNNLQAYMKEKNTSSLETPKILDKFCSFTSEKKDISCLNNIDDVKYFGDMKKIRQANECFIHRGVHHSPFFNANSGSPSSCLQNSVFGIKFVDGNGDCGPLALKIAIESAEDSLKFAIMEKIFTYVRDQFKFYSKKGLQEPATKAMNDMKKYLGMKKASKLTLTDYKNIKQIQNKLPVMLIRDAIFLAKIDLRFLADLKETSFIYGIFDELAVFIDESTNLKGSHATELETLESTLIEHHGTTQKMNQNLLSLYKEHWYDWLSAFRKNSSNHKSCYYLTTDDIVRLPKITNGLFGVLMTSENQMTKADHNSCAINDFGYYQYYKEHMFQVCSHFALLRNIDSTHYEIFYDKLSRRATFPVSSTKTSAISREKYIPSKTVLSLLHPEMRFRLLGESDDITEETEYHSFLMEIEEIPKLCEASSSFPKLEETRGHIEDWIERIEQESTLTSNLYNISNELIPWLQDMNSFLRDNELFEYESEVGKENISKYLVKMSVGEYVPIIFNYNALCGDKDIDNKLEDPQESLMSIAYVKKIYSTKNNISASYAYVFSDCNKTIFNSNFNNKFVYLFKKNVSDDQRKKYVFEMKDLRDGIAKNYWSFGFPSIYKIIRRNVLHNLLQLKHSNTGPFTNTIFDAADIIPDVWHISFSNDMTKMFKHLSLKCTERNKKSEYYCLYLLFLNSDQHLYRHLFIHGDRHFPYLLTLIKNKYANQIKLSFVAKNDQDIKHAIVESFKDVFNDEPAKDKFIQDSASKILTFMVSDLQVFEKYQPVQKSLIEADDVLSKDISSAKSSGFESMENQDHLKVHQFPQQSPTLTQTIEKYGKQNIFSPKSNDTLHESHSNKKRIHHWYNYIRWFEANDFEEVVKEKYTGVDFHRKSHQIQLILTFIYYKQVRKLFLKAMVNSFKKTFKHASKKILISEWMQVTQSLYMYVGKSNHNLFKFVITRKLIRETIVSIKNANINDGNTSESTTQSDASSLSSSQIKDTFTLHFLTSASLVPPDIEKKDILQLNLILKKCLNHVTNKNPIHPVTTNIKVIDHPRLRFHKRPSSKSFGISSNIDEKSIVFHIEDHQIPYKHLRFILEEGHALNTSQFSLAVDIFNHECITSTKYICLPPAVFQHWEASRRVDKKSILLYLQKLSLFVSKGDEITIKFDGVLFSLPRIDNPLLFKLYFINFKNKQLQIFDPVYAPDLIDNDMQSHEKTLLLQVLAVLLICCQESSSINRETILAEISAYDFVVETKNYFPKVEKPNDSSWLILFNMYFYMKDEMAGDSLTFVSSKPLYLFRQFVFGVLAQYHKCSSISEYVKSDYRTMKEQDLPVITKKNLVFDPSTLKLPHRASTIPTEIHKKNLHDDQSVISNISSELDKERDISMVSSTNKSIADKDEDDVHDEEEDEKEYNVHDEEEDEKEEGTEDDDKDEKEEVTESDSHDKKKEMTEDDSNYEKEQVTEDDSDTTTNESKNDDVVSAADTLLSILDGADNQSHIEFKTPIPRNDPDYKYVSNFYRKKTTHSRRDSASQSPHVGKSPRNPIKRSKHLPPDVKDFDVNYKLPKEQKARLNKIPINDIDEHERPEDYHQTEVDKLMKLQMKKQGCEYICQVSNSFLITKHNNLPVPRTTNVFHHPKVYPLEELAIREIDSVQYKKVHKTNVREFMKTVRIRRNQWHKFTASFKARFKHYIKEQTKSIAYWYMDYHAIRYDQATQKLMGLCYFEEKNIYEEELKPEVIVNVEKWHKQYMIAKTNAGDIIPLRIGKGGNVDKANDKSSRSKSNSTSSSTSTTINSQQLQPPTILSHDSTLNSPVDQPYQRFVQGNKNSCLEYSLYNCLETQKQFFLHKYQNNTTSSTFDNLTQHLKTAINESVGKNDTLPIIKETLQKHGWTTTNLMKSQKYLSTNVREFIEYTKRHRESIISVQLKDAAGNDNHWVSITHDKIHNARWNDMSNVNENDLHKCIGKGIFRGFRSILW